MVSHPVEHRDSVDQRLHAAKIPGLFIPRQARHQALWELKNILKEVWKVHDTRCASRFHGNTSEGKP